MITFTTTQRKYTLSIRPSSIYLFFFNLCPLWDAAVSGLCTFLFKHIHTYTYIHNDRCAKVIDGSRKGVEAGLCCCDSVWVSSLVSQMICQLHCVGVCSSKCSTVRTGIHFNRAQWRQRWFELRRFWSTLPLKKVQLVFGDQKHF